MHLFFFEVMLWYLMRISCEPIFYSRYVLVISVHPQMMYLLLSQVGMETEGFAIYDTMMLVKNEVYVLFLLTWFPVDGSWFVRYRMFCIFADTNCSCRGSYWASMLVASSWD